MKIDRDTEAWLKQRAIRVARDCTGLAESTASQIIDQVFAGLYEEFRGERLYLCQSLEARDADVRADFDGCNHDRVCRKHGISRRTLYRILKRSRTAA